MGDGEIQQSLTFDLRLLTNNQQLKTNNDRALMNNIINEPYLPFFFYGTLRPRDYNYLIHVEGRTLTEEAGYTLAGFELYDQGHYPLGRESADQSRVVVGDLIAIPLEIYPEILADIDELETYKPGRAENYYTRQTREVTGPDGQKQPAWVYIVTEEYFALLKSTLTLIANGDWLVWKAKKL